MLTQQQAQVLTFISDYQRREGGVSPSYQEIAAGVGIAAKSGAHYLVHELIDRGFIQILRGKKRAIQVLKTADGHAVAAPTNIKPRSHVVRVPEAGPAPAAIARACPQGRVS